MSKSINPLISFTAGEWSPVLDCRLDIPNYRKACRKLRNMIPLKQGAATRRPGTDYIANGKNYISGGVAQNSCSRLQKFQFAPGTTFMLEFCDSGIRFFSNGAQVTVSSAPAWVGGTSYPWGAFVTDGGVIYYAYASSLTPSATAPAADPTHWVAQSAYEVPTPYRANNFSGNNYWASDVFVVQMTQVNDVVYMVHPNFPVWKLTRVTDSYWTTQQVQFLTPAMLDRNATDITLTASAVTGTGVGLTATAPAWAGATYYIPSNAVLSGGLIYSCLIAHTSGTFATDLANGKWRLVTTFQAGHVGSYWQMSFNRPSSFVEVVSTGAGPYIFAAAASGTIPLIGGWSVQTYGTWTADVSIQASYDNGVTWQVIMTLTSRADANYNVAGEDITGAIYRFVVSNPVLAASATIPRIVFTANNQFVYGLVLISGYTSAYVATCSVVVPLYATTATPYWSEGAWSAVRGYPQAITVFQERVWYASSAFEPQRFWGTQTDDFENFALVDQSQPTYGLAFDLNAAGRGPIQWMNAQTDLFMGLAGAEWIVTSGQQNAAITPTQILALEHSVNGSAPALPGVIIGNACFYVQRKGSAFQQLLFSVFTNKYMSSDMQVLAEHMTAPGIKQFDYQQQFQNQSLLWAVVGNGSLVSLTYSMDQEVYGWARHTTGEVVVDAGDFVAAQTYTIKRIGTTDFTLIGALKNQVGLSFVATGVGTGTGTAVNFPDIGFISAQVIYGAAGQEDEVWVAVKRGNANYATIERLHPTDWQNYNAGLPALTQMRFADCNIAVTSPATSTIGGLPIVLSGRKAVASITPANNTGTWAIDDLAITDNGSVGQVTIPDYDPQAGDVVVVGLPINWAVQPMRLDVDLRAGPIPSITKAISKLFLRLLNSIGGEWSNAAGEIYPLPSYPINQIPDQPPPLLPNTPIEVQVDVAGVMQYDEDPVFVIEGNEPLPFTLLGVIVHNDIGGSPN